MKKIGILLLFGLLLCPVLALAETATVPSTDNIEPANVTSTDMIEQAAALDGQTVTYSGEVIGDIMRRGDNAWINVSDGNNAIGVWIPTDWITDVHTAGRYAEQGDEVRITGVFHRACREHGGDLDLHATQITLLSKGFETAHAVEPTRIVLAVILTLAAIGVLTKALMKK